VIAVAERTETERTREQLRRWARELDDVLERLRSEVQARSEDYGRWVGEGGSSGGDNDV
jgi:hypothetical protein